MKSGTITVRNPRPHRSSLENWMDTIESGTAPREWRWSTTLPLALGLLGLVLCWLVS